MRALKRIGWLAGALLAGAAGMAQAQTLPGLGDVLKANAELGSAVVAADAAGTQPPRLTDKAQALRIRTAFDIRALSQLPGNDLGMALRVCGPSTKTFLAYELFGLKKATGGAATPSAQAVQQLIGQNLVRFSDEAALGLRFNIACNAQLIAATAAFVGVLPADQWTPQRKTGLMQMRRGAVSTYVDVIQAQLYNMKAADKEMLLDQAVASAATHATAMDAGDKQRIIAALDVVAQTATVAPAAKAKLGQIRAAITAGSCTALCRS